MKKCTYCGKEYDDPMTRCPADGVLLQAQGAPAAGQPPRYANPASSGLAIASLVLGIISVLFCGPFCGIPAVICGHIALGRVKTNPAQYGGRGLAIAGLVTGYIGIVMIFFFAVLAGMLLPALAKAKQKAGQINCASNLKQVGLAVRIWSGDHHGVLPNSLLDLTNELGNPNVLVCPADPQHHRISAAAVQVWNPSNISYEFLTPGASENSVRTQVIIRCPIHGTEVLGDGTVKIKRSKKTAPNPANPASDPAQ